MFCGKGDCVMPPQVKANPNIEKINAFKTADGTMFDSFGDACVYQNRMQFNENLTQLVEEQLGDTDNRNLIIDFISNNITELQTIFKTIG